MLLFRALLTLIATLAPQEKGKFKTDQL